MVITLARSLEVSLNTGRALTIATSNLTPKHLSTEMKPTALQNCTHVIGKI